MPNSRRSFALVKYKLPITVHLSGCPMKKLFTEWHGMNEPRVKEELDVELTGGLLTVISTKIDENLFGEAFSEECQMAAVTVWAAISTS